MGLQHDDTGTKHIVPGAKTNDILVYNGSDFDAKKRESALNGITLETLTVTAFTATNANATTFKGTTVNVTDVVATNANVTTTKGTTVNVTDTITNTVVAANSVISPRVFGSKTITVKNSTANYTLTAAEVLGGIVSDTTVTNAVSVTLPTVANTVAAIPGWKVGTSFTLFYRNPGNQTITLYTDANTQWTLLGTNTIPAANAKSYDFVIATNVTGTVVCKGAVIA